MKIQVSCKCGRKLAAKAEFAGKRIKCPGCGAVLQLPESSGGGEPAADTVRCDFCHQYIPESEYSTHVEKHLKRRDDGQQTDYATLPPEERESAIDFESAPRWYRHLKCDAVTGMPEEIIETYLTDPWFYLADKTFCTGCEKHVAQRECVWEETGENLQEYIDRLRAAKPELRPGLPKRMLVKVLSMLFS